MQSRLSSVKVNGFKYAHRHVLFYYYACVSVCVCVCVCVCVVIVREAGSMCPWLTLSRGLRAASINPLNLSLVWGKLKALGMLSVSVEDMLMGMK